MLELEPKEVMSLLEWAGLEAPKTPPRQLSSREKEKLGKTFTPKEHKVSSVRDAANRGPAGKSSPTRKPAAQARKPAAANRRVRQASDLSPPKMQKKSDRNRGRG
jgi:23S rRNA pseudouridine2605 synthase